ncbi:DUF47 family protein [bacterium]|nr:DUF47 family protein [bacterium]
MKLSKRGWILILLFSITTLLAFAGNETETNSIDAKSFYSLGDFFRLLGSLGLFLFGMKYMSEGIQKAAGSKLRQILRAVTANKFLGIITGVFVTTLIQSSSATTVMVVSFANAGLFSLSEAISVIMGANVGTTVTGWIIAIFGKVDVSDLALPILGIAFPFLFIGGDKLKNWAEFVIGFSLLFFGLGELKDSVPDIQQNPDVLEFISHWSGMGFWSLILFIIIGSVLTIIVQSSSASMALTIVLLSKGWIDFPTGAAMILGENIGTTVTAQLAALIANLNAKRAAMAHTLFNVTGVLWMILVFTPFLHMVEWIISISQGLYCEVMGKGCDLDPNAIDLFTKDPSVLADVGPIGLAVFHTSFNIINVLLLVWFSNVMAIVVKAIWKGRGNMGTDVLKYLDSGMMNTPELAVIEAQKELLEFGQLVEKMFKTNLILLFRDGTKKQKKAAKKILGYEEECDEKEREIARYLADLSMKNLSKATAYKIRKIWSIINDMERIGDMNEKIMLSLQKNEDIVVFNDQTLAGLKTVTNKVDEAFAMMMNILDREEDTTFSLLQVKNLEQEINEMRDNLRNAFFIEIENSSISFQTGLVAVEVVSNLEKIADHIYSINIEMLEMG